MRFETSGLVHMSSVILLGCSLCFIGPVSLWAQLFSESTNPRYTMKQYSDGRTQTVAGKLHDNPKFAIVIHGGAGGDPDRFSDEANGRREQSLEQALRLGVEILKAGGTALDAVEQVVVFLENDPQFNAGVGAVYNSAGSHELDAAIMDGRTKDCGAVANVSRIKNPILAARAVMTNTKHILLAGDGAEAFARENGFEMVEPDYFDTPTSREAWERRRGQNNQEQTHRLIHASPEDIGTCYGTVGCVALDTHGNLAAATSTGGMSNKRYGRIGDTPLVGAGTYADNETCAVSGTGIGEQFIRHNVAYDVAARMKYLGQDVGTAVREILEKQLSPQDGGIIAVSKDGQMAFEFNSKAMSGGVADSSGRFEIYWRKK